CKFREDENVDLTVLNYNNISEITFNSTELRSLTSYPANFNLTVTTPIINNILKTITHNVYVVPYNSSDTNKSTEFFMLNKFIATNLNNETIKVYSGGVLNTSIPYITTTGGGGLGWLTFKTYNELNTTQNISSNLQIKIDIVYPTWAKSYNFNLNIPENNTAKLFYTSPINISTQEIYSASGYATRMYILPKIQLNGSFDRVAYLLPYAYSTYVMFHVSDINGFPKKDVSVTAKKYDFGTGQTYPVSSCLTDNTGACGMWLRVDNTFYFWEVTEMNGTVLFTSSSPQQISCSPSCVVYITIGEKGETPQGQEMVNAECKVNLTYTEQNGSLIKKIPTSGFVICNVFNMNNSTLYLNVTDANKTLICQNTSVTTPITCFLAVNITNIYKLYYIGSHGEFVYLSAGGYYPEKEVIFGEDGILFGIFGIVILALLFAHNTVLIGFSLMVGGIALSVLQITPSFIGFIAAGIGGFIILVSLKMGGRI
ncbi:MAG: hypothetical protein ACUVT3_11375, partial [Ignavibacterium sp.]